MAPLSDAPEGSAPGRSLTAVPLRLEVLKKRRDFLQAARAQYTVTPGFILQMRRRGPCAEDQIRVGFTCSKKVGNAVARNHAKRRLREIARLVLPAHGRPATDYVLIGKAHATRSRDFEEMKNDLRRALHKLHGEHP